MPALAQHHVHRTPPLHPQRLPHGRKQTHQRTTRTWPQFTHATGRIARPAPARKPLEWRVFRGALYPYNRTARRAYLGDDWCTSRMHRARNLPQHKTLYKKSTQPRVIRRCERTTHNAAPPRISSDILRGRNLPSLTSPQYCPPSTTTLPRSTVVVGHASISWPSHGE